MGEDTAHMQWLIYGRIDYMKDIKTLKDMISHLLTMLTAKQRWQMAGMTFIILIGSLFELLGVSAMLPFIEALLEPSKLISRKYIQFFMTTFGIKGTSSMLTMIGVGIVGIYVIKNTYLAVSSYLQVSFSNSIRRQLSSLMLRSYMSRPYSFFVDNGSGVLLRGCKDDIACVRDVVFNLFKIGAEGFVVLTVAIYLFTVDPFLALGVLLTGMACMIIIVFGIKKMLTRLSYVYREATEKLGRFITQVNDGIKDIMVFNRRDMFLEEYDKAYEESNSAEIKYDFSNLIPERIIEACCISGIIIMVLVRLGMGVDPVDFVPKMAVFAMGAFRLLPSISRLTGFFSVLIYSRPMVEATYENYISARNYRDDNQSVVASDIDNDSLKFTNLLEIRNLDWKYPQGKSKVLDNLSISVHKGEAVGIIGESGSGKSTLADLILRLYRPQKGGIYMDGIDIATIPNAWSRVMAYVPQTVFMMDDTIRANVVFGSPHEQEEDIWEALRKASLEEFVRNLPDGLDTIVGEHGVKFSGGQRQRVAIARALYIRPQIMILDEATSALDNDTESAVMEAIDSLAGSMTLIIIAHRLTTLKNCNRIYEISEGKALEREYERDILHTV